MKFRLTYEGEIKPRQTAGLPHIHSIRQHLHPQLRRVWEHAPLSELKGRWLRDENPGDPNAVYARIIAVNNKRYAPLVAADLGAELDIIFLRQQAKGQLIGEGGDNRQSAQNSIRRSPNAEQGGGTAIGKCR